MNDVSWDVEQLVKWWSEATHFSCSFCHRTQRFSYSFHHQRGPLSQK